MQNVKPVQPVVIAVPFQPRDPLTEEERSLSRFHALTISRCVLSEILSEGPLNFLSFAALLLAASATAHAQGYPTRPLRLIVPIAAGGGMDIVSRRVGQKLGDKLGQTVVIDNRAGGGGSIGVELAANATPDGYTLLMMSSSAVVFALLYQARYDLARDFAPLTQLTSQPYLIVVNPSLPIRSVAELVAYAKSNPGKLNYASSGIGSLTNLSGELFKMSVKSGPKSSHSGNTRRMTGEL